MSRTLLLWGDAPAEEAARAHVDTMVVAWDEAGERRLRAAGARFRTLSEFLGAVAPDAIDEAAITWTKEWGRRPLVDGRTFRELARWKGLSLWWFAELFLHHSTDAPRRVRTIETVHRLLEATRAEEVDARGLGAEEALLVERTCTARAVLFATEHVNVRVRGVTGILRQHRLNEAKLLATVLKTRLAGPPSPPPSGRAGALLLSHAAFWREREAEGGREVYEHYFDRLLPALEADGELTPFVLAVGPREAFRRRGARERWGEWLRLTPDGGPYVHVNRYVDAGVRAEVRRAGREIRALWRRLRGTPAVREAFAHRGVPFGDLSEADLASTMLLQLPWAVRAWEEMAAALRAVRPSVVVLYAESSGWGRAALAACGEAGVPTVAVQHGILYPKYYSYRHEADEIECPRPDRTAVFGDEARRLLVSMGSYAPETLVVTGSPKFDALVEAARGWDRGRERARLMVAADEPLLVVASRFRSIRSTHQSIGSAFPALVRAVEKLGARCLVKPHPAEPSSPYEAVLRAERATRTRVLPPSEDLVPLLHAADALVTVESLSAVEALVLGRPVVLLNQPSHLRALAEAEVAVAVPAGEDPTDPLRRLLTEPSTRAALEAARDRYLSDVAHGVDGGATARLCALVRETALAPKKVVPPGVVA